MCLDIAYRSCKSVSACIFYRVCTVGLRQKWKRADTRRYQLSGSEPRVVHPVRADKKASRKASTGRQKPRYDKIKCPSGQRSIFYSKKTCSTLPSKDRLRNRHDRSPVEPYSLSSNLLSKMLEISSTFFRISMANCTLASNKNFVR